MSNSIITRKGRNQKHDILGEIHAYDMLFDTREIFVHGEPTSENEDGGVDFRMANRFLKNIRLLESSGDDPIIVHQNSIGGEWDCGMMMYDAIATCSCHVICVMHGFAYSMGSIIPQAADTRIIMPNCIFMVHDGTTCFDGTLKQITSFHDLVVSTRDIYLDIFANVCVNGSLFIHEQADIKKVKQEIIEKLDQKEDWWLFARDTVSYGFADAVLGDPNYETLDTIKGNIINGD